MGKLFVFSVLGFVASFSALSCRNSKQSLDADRLNLIIAREVKVGDSEQRLLEFYAAYDWRFGYDKWTNAYRSSFIIDNRNNILAHMVTVQVLLTKEKTIREITVIDSLK